MKKSVRFSEKMKKINTIALCVHHCKSLLRSCMRPAISFVSYHVGCPWRLASSVPTSSSSYFHSLFPFPHSTVDNTLPSKSGYKFGIHAQRTFCRFAKQTTSMRRDHRNTLDCVREHTLNKSNNNKRSSKRQKKVHAIGSSITNRISLGAATILVWIEYAERGVTAYTRASCAQRIRWPNGEERKTQ